MVDDNSFAWMICSKKPYRKLEDYALTLAGIPPLAMSALKTRSEDNALNRLYLEYLNTLQCAVAHGDLNAARCNGHWVCRYEDFKRWAKLCGYGAFKEPTDFDGDGAFYARECALKRWVTSKGLEPPIDGQAIKIKYCPELKHYTKPIIYAELCSYDDVFLMAEATFSDFWQKQKILKFK